MKARPPAPVDRPNPPHHDDDDAGGPSLDFTPRKIAVAVVFVLLAVVSLYFLLPRLAGLEETWHRIEDGSPGWLALALVFAVGMFLGYAILFQIASLWACFRAFGDAPPFGGLVLAFFLGQLGNLLPLPGGIGGVDGGLIGAYAAFGVDAGLAVVAVLVFRAFTFWLPLIPGVVAFIRLRGTIEQWRRERGATIQSKA